MQIKIAVLPLIIISIFVCFESYATHIMGGNIELRALESAPGRYKIIVKTYIDLAGATDAESQHFITVRRKNDDSVIETFLVPLISTKQVIYENETCTETRRLKTLFAYYEADITLDPSKYTDPEGYYLLWNNCCRNGAIVNLRDPLNTTTYLRTFFPPLIKSGKLFLDSSPSFGELEGAYICIGEPFYFPFDAVDPDGDELSYSLQDPTGYNSLTGSGPEWQPGYSANNAIPGNPALQINPKTGELYVVPNQLGLFVFSVTVNELRNGEIIGSVQRDYQLYVVDCPPVSPPDPTVTIDGQIATEASVCNGRSVKLSSLKNNEWNYQWKKNGKNIEGADADELIVSESGQYQLVTSLAGTCSKTGRSAIVNINVTQSNFKLKTDGKPVICSSNGKLTLYAVQSSHYTYQWFKDGTQVTAKSDSLVATDHGFYWAIVNDAVNGCKSFSDTIPIKTSPIPPLTLTSKNTQTTICRGDSILLLSTERPDYHYIWFKNDQPIISTNPTVYVNQPGMYKVSVTDSAGCGNTSNTFGITLLAETSIQIDPIDPICGPNSVPVPLKATSSEGVFSGPGVEANSFIPQKAGPGIHEIIYTVSGPASCANSAKTTIVVHPSPDANAGKDVFVREGESGIIGSDFINGLSYLWEPTLGLDNPNKSNPLVTPPQDIEYLLTVTDLNGCAAQDKVKVRITHQVLIPDAFTPNGDGINETWVLRGIAAYPDAEVTIFNRWGNDIYHSKGYQNAFDGTFQGKTLAPGAYPYIITLDTVKSPIRGNLMLIR